MDSASNEYENGALKTSSPGSDAGESEQNSARLVPYLFGPTTGNPRVDIGALPVITAYDTNGVVRRDVATMTPVQISEANSGIKFAQSNALTLTSQTSDTTLPAGRKSTASDKVNLSGSPIETGSHPTEFNGLPIKRSEVTNPRTDLPVPIPVVLPVGNQTGTPLAVPTKDTVLPSISPVGESKQPASLPGLPLPLSISNDVAETPIKRGVSNIITFGASTPETRLDPLTGQPVVIKQSAERNPVPIAERTTVPVLESQSPTHGDKTRPVVQQMLDNIALPVILAPRVTERVETVKAPITAVSSVIENVATLTPEQLRAHKDPAKIPTEPIIPTAFPSLPKVPEILRTEIVTNAQTTVTQGTDDTRNKVTALLGSDKPIPVVKTAPPPEGVGLAPSIAAAISVPITPQVSRSETSDRAVIKTEPLAIVPGATNIAGERINNGTNTLGRLAGNEVKPVESAVINQPGVTRQVSNEITTGRAPVTAPGEVTVPKVPGTVVLPDGTVRANPTPADATGVKPIIPGAEINTNRPALPGAETNTTRPAIPGAENAVQRTNLNPTEGATKISNPSGGDSINRAPAAAIPADSAPAQAAVVQGGKIQDQPKVTEQQGSKLTAPTEAIVKQDTGIRSDVVAKVEGIRVENKVADTSAVALPVGEKRSPIDPAAKPTIDGIVVQDKGLPNATLRIADGAAKIAEAIVRKDEPSAKAAEIIARIPEVAAKNIESGHKFSDAIVKVAESAGKIADGAPANKIDLGQVKVADLSVPLNTLGQQIKNDALIVGQKQVDQAQNLTANPVAKNIEIANAQGHKVGEAPKVDVGRRPIDHVKVDQIVADFLVNNRGSKEQTPVGKILSALDNSNISNQQVDPKNLLDAAAVRRILDGQLVNLNPNLNPTILEGITPPGQLPGDYALPSLGSLNLSQIIGLGEKLQEAVTGAGTETADVQQKSQVPQHRTKYIVKEGDTLESISEFKLGDARLVRLLITINRAQIGYAETENGKIAYVVPDQSLWLPTPDEIEVHKKNFFGKKDKHGNYTGGSSSQQNTPVKTPMNFDRTQVSGEISGSFQDFRPSPMPSGNRVSAGYEMKYGKVSKPNSQPVKEEVVEEEVQHNSVQISHRQCYQVGVDETLISIAASLPSMGHISMWRLLAKINGYQLDEDSTGKPLTSLSAGQFIVLPTQVELNEFKLMEKLDSASFKAGGYAQESKPPEARTITPPPAMKMLEQGMGSKSTVHKLSSYTRLVLTDLAQNEDCFSVKIEARIDGTWLTLANYECNFGRTTRHLYNRDGEIKSMDLDLPPFVVKEMAKEDFVRNWNSYVNIFMGVQA